MGGGLEARGEAAKEAEWEAAWWLHTFEQSPLARLVTSGIQRKARLISYGLISVSEGKLSEWGI